MSSKAVAGRPEWVRRQLTDWDIPHSHADEPAGTTGEQDRPHNPGFQCGKVKPHNLWL